MQTKKAYEKASEEAENAMHTLEKADNDPNSTKAKIDKVREIREGGREGGREEGSVLTLHLTILELVSHASPCYVADYHSTAEGADS